MQQGVLSTNSCTQAGVPIKKASAAEMAASATTAYVGRIIRYTGQTANNYTSGALYIVENGSV